MARASMIVGLAVLAAACGPTHDEAPADVPPQLSVPTVGCGDPPLPPSKFIPHENGVPGQYIVRLVAPVADVAEAAAALSATYGGEVMSVYTAALEGFAVRIEAGGAEAMSADARVCYVDQDDYAHGT